MISIFLFAVGVTLPVCIMLMVGYLLSIKGVIDEHFISVSSKLVYYFGMPALLFFNVSSIKDVKTFDWLWIDFVFLCTVGGFVLAWLVSLLVKLDWKDRGVFIQGGARGNIGIIGIALASSLYGKQGIVLMSITLAVAIPMYNIFSIFLLSYYGEDGKEGKLWSFVKRVISNPLIIAVILGLISSTTGYVLPETISQVGHDFAQLALPLALLGAGGKIRIDSLSQFRGVSCWAALVKVVFFPILVIPIAMALGYSGQILGVIFLMVSCPTAATTFVMAKATGSNDELAANIIALSTLCFLPQVSIGLMALRAMGVV